MKKYIINIVLSIITSSAYSHDYLNPKDSYSPVFDYLSNKMHAVYTGMEHDIKSENGLSLRDIGDKAGIRVLEEPEDSYPWNEDNKIVMRDGKTLYLLIRHNHSGMYDDSEYKQTGKILYALNRTKSAKIGGYHIFPSFHGKPGGNKTIQGIPYYRVKVDKIEELSNKIDRYHFYERR